MTFPLLGNLSNDLSDDEVHPPYNLGPRNTTCGTGHVGCAIGVDKNYEGDVTWTELSEDSKLYNPKPENSKNPKPQNPEPYPKSLKLRSSAERQVCEPDAAIG